MTGNDGRALGTFAAFKPPQSAWKALHLLARHARSANTETVFMERVGLVPPVRADFLRDLFRLFFGMPTSGDAAANPGGGGPLGLLLISVLGMVAVLLLFLLVANPDLELVGGKGRGLRGLAVCCAWRACTASASPWSRARPRPVRPMRTAIRPDGGPVGRSRSDWRSCQTLKPRRLQRPMRGSRACQQLSSLSSC